MNRQQPRTVSKPPSEVVAIIDGAARGNPGPAAYGVVFRNAAGKTLTQRAETIGETTNNVAEYRALLAALTYAHEQGWRRLKVQTDSELLARQLMGSYRVREAHLKPLYQQAQQLIAQLDAFTVEAVPRKLTREADRLANAALDLRSQGFARGKPATRLSRAQSRDAPRPVSGKGRAGAQLALSKSKGPLPPLSQRLSPVAPATGTRIVRAVYQGGVLIPRTALDLNEGEEVELEIRRKCR